MRTHTTSFSSSVIDTQWATSTTLRPQPRQISSNVVEHTATQGVSETRAITTGSGEKTKHFTGQTYLFHYALPHFFFHATTAYDILRHNGIEVGKKDFIGSY